MVSGHSSLPTFDWKILFTAHGERKETGLLQDTRNVVLARLKKY